MPDSPPSAYWDACVLLAYINGEQDRVIHVETFLEDAEKGAIVLFTSTLSVVEVAFAAEEKLAGKLDPALEEKMDELWLPASPVKRVEMHMGIGQIARSLIRDAMVQGWGLQAADATHLATAKQLQVDVVHTYETKAKRDKWANLLKIPVEEPTHPSPKLFASGS